MKLFLKIVFFLLFPVFLKAQTLPSQLDMLQQELKNSPNDTIRMNLYDKLGWYYAEINRDSSLSYFEMELPIARKLNLKLYEADALNGTGYILTQLGNYPKALEALLEGQKIARTASAEENAWNLTHNAWNTSGSPNPKDARLDLLGWILNEMGQLYGLTGNTSNEISNLFEARSLAASVRDTTLLEVTNMHLGDVYFNVGKLDSALIFQQEALFLYTHSNVFKKYEGDVLSAIGAIYLQKGDFDQSRDAFLKSVNANEEQKNLSGLAWGYLSLANLYQATKKPDSGMFYARKALETFNDVSLPSGISDTYSLFSSIYAKHNKPDSAYAYLKLATDIKDSLNNAGRTNLLAFKNKDFDELMRLKELEEEKIQTQTKIRTFALLAGIGVFILITLLLYRNNKNRQKANALLQKQKEEIETQKKNVERTLTELTATQVQLIQSEKMASLGELTAGIAHEIQNPLNFVNNFSEVNKELVDELQTELKAGRIDDAFIISNDIKSNEEKINLHGKRADAIVKGMLQHSRTSTGQKEPTDINALADEYLRLSYHGIRAKDKNFNATIKTDFDENIGKVNVIPQDIGRVLLNLYNNAFYSVNERKNQSVDTYEPTVTVSTKKMGDRILISVEDNGNGIPKNIVDKIFQPFFTTKPTGQGTGLGLSLSYDIVKAHGGELKVETKEGEGSLFIFQLPNSNA
ncbi:MAG: ATP-binding protein [Bacteroidota bacterium]